MNTIYEENLLAFEGKIKSLEAAAAASTDYTYEIAQAKNGSPTIKLEIEAGRWIFLHSAYDPVAEASKIVSIYSSEAGLYVVFGFGLGYCVEELMKVTGPMAQIAVIEPNPSSFRAALRHRPLSRVLKDKRIFWFFGDNLELLARFFDRVYHPFQAGNPELVIPPVMKQAYRSFFERSLDLFRDTVSRKVVNVNTLYHLGASPVINSLRNILHALENPGCATLFDRFRGIPAIIVSAGPSLDKNIQELARAKGKAVIICAGSTIKAMIKAGIKPDFIYSIDPQPAMYEEYLKNADSGSFLVANLQTHPDVIKNFPDQKFISYYRGTPITSLLAREIADVGEAYTGGSVANDCLSFAYKIGANPIIFVGQDLSYGERGQTHASGRSPERAKIDVNTKKINFLKVKANNGEMVDTGRDLYAFLKWFELWIAERKDRLYINATEGGAHIAGTKTSTLKEAISNYCTKDIDVKETVAKACQQYKTPDRDAILNKFFNFQIQSKNLHKYTAQGIDLLKKLEKICLTNDKDQQQKELLLRRVKKIYRKLEQNEILKLVESLVPKGVNTVLARVYKYHRTDNDTYLDAIANYTVYLENIKEGCQNFDTIISELIEQIQSREAC